MAKAFQSWKTYLTREKVMRGKKDKKKEKKNKGF